MTKEEIVRIWKKIDRMEYQARENLVMELLSLNEPNYPIEFDEENEKHLQQLMEFYQRIQDLITKKKPQKIEETRKSYSKNIQTCLKIRDIIREVGSYQFQIFEQITMGLEEPELENPWFISIMKFAGYANFEKDIQMEQEITKQKIKIHEKNLNQMISTLEQEKGE